MKIRIIFFFLLLFNASSITAQLDIDSLKNIISNNLSKTDKSIVFSELCRSYIYVNPDTSIFYGEKAIEIFNTIKAKDEDINSLYYNLGTAYLESNLSKSKYYFTKFHQYSLKTNNDSIIATNYLALAAYYSRIPDIDSSSYYNILATERFKLIGDSTALAYCYYNLMSNYNDIKKEKKSISYAEQAYEIANAKKIEPLLSYLTINMAFIYSKMEGKESLAKEFITKAKIIADKSQNFQVLTSIYLTLGAKSLKEENYLEAVQEFKQALNYSIESKDSMRISMTHNSLGKVYYKLNDLNKAAENFKKDIETNRNTLSAIQVAYFHLAMIYANNDKKQHDFYTIKYDSISSIILNTSSEEILAKYETSEKEREIEQLKLKEIENDLIIQKKNFRSTILVFTLLLLTFLIAFLYNRNRNKQSILEQKIKLEKQKVLQTEKELSLKLEALKNNNNLISELKEKLKTTSNNDALLNSIINSFEESYVSEKQWDNIILQFDNLEKDFVKDLNINYSNLTKNDIKLSILIKLEYSNSGMAEILNISIEGIKKAKQRLKKKIKNL